MFTLDRLRRQQSLRIQIEDEIRKIQNFESSADVKPINLEELEMLYSQVTTCKISITEEHYVKSLIDKCKEIEAKFRAMIQNKVFISEFKDLQSEIQSMPVSMPEISAQLKLILEKTSALSTRMKILREYSGKNKIDRSKVEQFLNDYKHADAKIEDAEDLLSELEYGKQITTEASNLIETADISLDQLNSISGRLSSMKINMGQDEKILRVKIWKLKVKLSQTQKVGFSVLVGWYNEGKNMKEPVLLADLDRLESLINKGDKYKDRLANCKSIDQIEEIEQETEKLPFDLAHSIIEHKTRINLSSKMHVNLYADDEPIIAKKSSADAQNESEASRQGYVIAIEQKIIGDINYDWESKTEKAKKLANKIELIA